MLVIHPVQVQGEGRFMWKQYFRERLKEEVRLVLVFEEQAWVNGKRKKDWHSN